MDIPETRAIQWEPGRYLTHAHLRILERSLTDWVRCVAHTNTALPALVQWDVTAVKRQTTSVEKKPSGGKRHKEAPKSMWSLSVNRLIWVNQTGLLQAVVDQTVELAGSGPNMRVEVRTGDGEPQDAEWSKDEISALSEETVKNLLRICRPAAEFRVESEDTAVDNGWLPLGTLIGDTDLTLRPWFKVGNLTLLPPVVNLAALAGGCAKIGDGLLQKCRDVLETAMKDGRRLSNHSAATVVRLYRLLEEGQCSPAQFLMELEDAALRRGVGGDISEQGPLGVMPAVLGCTTAIYEQLLRRGWLPQNIHEILKKLVSLDEPRPAKYLPIRINTATSEETEGCLRLVLLAPIDQKSTKNHARLVALFPSASKVLPEHLNEMMVSFNRLEVRPKLNTDTIGQVATSDGSDDLPAGVMVSWPVGLIYRNETGATSGEPLTAVNLHPTSECPTSLPELFWQVST